MNCFALLPDETFRDICSYLCMSRPIMRKVCRRWRLVLETADVDDVQCMDYAIVAYKWKINVGDIKCADIWSWSKYDCYGLLLCADYAWKISQAEDIHFLYNIYLNCVNFMKDARADDATAVCETDATALCETDASNLFLRIVSKCTTEKTDPNMYIIVNAAVLIGNLDLITRIHKLGFPFPENIICAAGNVEIAILLLDLGYKLPDNIVRTLIDRAIDPRGRHRLMEYGLLFKWVLMKGCKVTKADLKYAQRIDHKFCADCIRDTLRERKNSPSK